MSDSQKHHVKELKNVLRDIDEGGKEKCTMCRFVLVFSFATLILVVLFVFFSGPKERERVKLVPLPPELMAPVDPGTRESDLRNLVEFIHPEFSTSTILKLNATSTRKTLPIK